MSIEAACRTFAGKIHRNQLQIYPGGPDGGGCDPHRFDVGFGRVMTVEVNCFGLFENGPSDITLAVHQGSKLLRKKHFRVSGNIQGAIDIGYGVVLTSDPWTLRKIQHPRARLT